MLLRADTEVSGLRFVVVPERTCLLRVVLRHLPSGARHRGTIDRRAVAIDFAPVRAGDGLVGVLEVEYSGDAPMLSGLEWSVDPARPHNPFTGLLEVEPLVELGLVVARGDPDTDELRVPWDAAMLLYGAEIGLAPAKDEATPTAAPSDRYAVRHDAEEMDAAARRFFFELDRNTLGPDVDLERRELVRSVTEVLSLRVRERASVGSRYVPAWEPSERRTQRLRVVSAFVRTLMETHLDERARPGIVEWAFTRFATESLSTTHLVSQLHLDLRSHGAPAGELFFSFAELALACIELDIDRAHWERHLSVLVRSAHVYAEHGGVRNSRGRYIYVYRENRRFPLERLVDLERSYVVPARVSSTTFLEDRFTSMLSMALSVRAEQPPPAKARDVVHIARFRRQSTALVNQKQAREFFASTDLFLRPLRLA